MDALLAEPVAPQAAAERAASFRRAMSHLASAVAIVACRREGRPHGVLVSSLTSLSLEPPRLLFCVRKAAGSHDALLRSDRISVAILSGAEVEEARTFSDQDLAADRFVSARWRHEAFDPPRLDGGLVNLDCTLYQRICAGSHTIFIVDVDEVSAGGDNPLLYFQGRYRRLQDERKGATA